MHCASRRIVCLAGVLWCRECAKMLGCNCDGGNTRMAGLRGLRGDVLDTAPLTKAVSPAGKLAITGAVGVLLMLGFVMLAKRRA